MARAEGVLAFTMNQLAAFTAVAGAGTISGAAESRTTRTFITDATYRLVPDGPVRMYAIEGNSHIGPPGRPTR